MDLLYVGFASWVVAMGVTWAMTPIVIRAADWLGAVDLPGGRKAHVTPVPRIGGVAVFCGFVAGLAFAALATGTLFSWVEVNVYWRGFALAAAGMLLVGLYDDLWGLSFRWKFVAQIVAAVYIWQCGFRIDLISHPMGGMIDLGPFSLPMTVLWVVGITNAVNLIDGLDGLAAGIALITTGTLAVIALNKGSLGVTAASVALAGALVGFLRFNFNPARIFLGDSGSLFLGFVLAVMSVKGSHKGSTVVAVLVPLLTLGLPLLDTGLAVIRRLVQVGNRGIQTDAPMRYIFSNLNHLFLPDRGHLHHRLLDLGLSHRGAVLTLYGAGVVFALAAFSLVLVKSVAVALLLVATLLGIMAACLVTLYIRVWAQEHAARRAAQAAELTRAPKLDALAPSGGRHPGP